MKTYEITLRVTENLLTTIIDVTRDSASIVGIKFINDETPAKKRQMRYANGIRVKDIKGKDLVMQVVADGRVHGFGDFEAAFSKHSFAASSVQSTVHKALKDGLIIRHINGNFQRKA